MAPQIPPGDSLARLIAGNGRFRRGQPAHTVRQICSTPEARARLAQGRARIVGAVYEFESGRVRLLAEGI